jgi:hypothetical protein
MLSFWEDASQINAKKASTSDPNENALWAKQNASKV